jgi:hypothetical protein
VHVWNRNPFHSHFWAPAGPFPSIISRFLFAGHPAGAECSVHYRVSPERNARFTFPQSTDKHSRYLFTPRDPPAIRIGQFVSLAIRVRVIAGGKSSPVSEMERPLSSQISEDRGLRHPFARSCSLRFSPSSLAIASTTSDHPGASPRLFVNDKCVPGTPGARGVSVPFDGTCFAPRTCSSYEGSAGDARGIRKTAEISAPLMKSADNP